MNSQIKIALGLKSKDDYVNTVISFFDCIENHDEIRMKEFMADNVVWEYQIDEKRIEQIKGIHDVSYIFQNLDVLNYKGDVHYLARTGNYVLDSHYGYNLKGKGREDQKWLLLYHLNPQGKIDKIESFHNEVDNDLSFKAFLSEIRKMSGEN